MNWFYKTGEFRIPAAFEIGLEEKWLLAEKLHKNAHFEDQRVKIMETLAQIDSSETLVNNKIKFEALTADAQKKQEIWDSYLKKDQTLSLRQAQYQMRGFNYKMEDQYVKAFFDVISHVNDIHPREFSKYFYLLLFPVSE